jgi:hypothetical protein
MDQEDIGSCFGEIIDKKVGFPNVRCSYVRLL